MKTNDEIQKSKSGKLARRKGLDNEARLLEKIRVYFPNAKLGPPSGAKGGDFEGIGRFQLEAKKLVSLPTVPEKALSQADRDAKGYAGVDVSVAVLSDTASPGARVEDRVYLRLEEFLEIASAEVEDDKGRTTAPVPEVERAPAVEWEQEIRTFLETTLSSAIKKTIFGRGKERVFHAEFNVPAGLLEKLAESLGWSDEKIEDYFSDIPKTLGRSSLT